MTIIYIISSIHLIITSSYCDSPDLTTKARSVPSWLTDSITFSLLSHQNTRWFLQQSMASPAGRKSLSLTSVRLSSPVIHEYSIFGVRSFTSVQYISLTTNTVTVSAQHNDGGLNAGLLYHADLTANKKFRISESTVLIKICRLARKDTSKNIPGFMSRSLLDLTPSYCPKAQWLTDYKNFVKINP